MLAVYCRATVSLGLRALSMRTANGDGDEATSWPFRNRERTRNECARVRLYRYSTLYRALFIGNHALSARYFTTADSGGEKKPFIVYNTSDNRYWIQFG